MKNIQGRVYTKLRLRMETALDNTTESHVAWAIRARLVQIFELITYQESRHDVEQDIYLFIRQGLTGDEKGQ